MNSRTANIRVVAILAGIAGFTGPACDSTGGREIERTRQAVFMGTEKSEFEFPPVGRLIYEEPSLYDLCTATVVGPSTVLTASHCVKRPQVQNYRFTIGGITSSVANIWDLFGTDYQALTPDGLGNKDMALVSLTQCLPAPFPDWAQYVTVVASPPIAGDTTTLYGAGDNTNVPGQGYGVMRYGSWSYQRQLDQYKAYNGEWSIMRSADSGGPVIFGDHSNFLQPFQIWAIASQSNLVTDRYANVSYYSSEFQDWVGILEFLRPSWGYPHCQ